MSIFLSTVFPVIIIRSSCPLAYLGWITVHLLFSPFVARASTKVHPTPEPYNVPDPTWLHYSRPYSRRFPLLRKQKTPISILRAFSSALYITHISIWNSSVYKQMRMASVCKKKLKFKFNFKTNKVQISIRKQGMEGIKPLKNHNNNESMFNISMTNTQSNNVTTAEIMKIFNSGNYEDSHLFNILVSLSQAIPYPLYIIWVPWLKMIRQLTKSWI